MSDVMSPPDRILAVDDDPALLRVYQRVLSAAGYAVDVATNGLEASVKLMERSYSAIVSDVAMPGMDGISLLRTAHNHDRNIPVILVTGDTTAASAIDAVNEGAFGFLVKPLDIAALETGIRRAVLLHRSGVAHRLQLAEAGISATLTSEAASLETQFESALGSLSLAFQPIVQAADGALFGYEGLLRTREPSLPSPGDVLGAAEHLGRLSTLGRKVRSMAAAQFQSTDSPGALFVNLHPADLVDDKLLDRTAPLSEIAHRVVLEITERAMLDSVPQAHERLRDLRSMGFRIAIDDLGAGYAGLNSFVQLEPELVKIDMSLIRGIETSRVKQRLVKSVVEVCVDLDIRIVAEGIETAAEKKVVTDLGCDLLQGYLLGRPSWPLPERSLN